MSDVRRFGTRTLAVAFAIVAAFVSCGDSEENGSGKKSACESAFKGVCGSACTLDADCPTGLYCDGTGSLHGRLFAQWRRVWFGPGMRRLRPVRGTERE